MNIANSILAISSSGGNCAGNALVATGANISDDATCGGSISKPSTNPQLGLLTGSPAYFPLNTGSPAIDASIPATCTYLSTGTNPLFTNGAAITNDERGYIRPAGTGCDLGAYESSASAPTITISPSSLPNGALNTAYSQLFSASGGYGTYTFASSDLPTSGWSGLSLSSAGVLSGTPTATGLFSFHVVATDSEGFTSVSTLYSINVPVVATMLVFTAQPSNTTAGAIISPSVQIIAENSLGSIDTTFTGTVGIAIANNPGAVP